ncbi:MAG TPA: L,D-transpeptidase family protein [Xanthobacteraceae bacterium]|nr:L,D-transpeptidase family protein [Xanthobacteraceae bacterium]
MAVVGAACFAGSLGSAAAQSLPPQPVPAPYDAPPVYRDQSGAPIDPHYVQPNAEDDAAPGEIASRPYFAPQPLPVSDDRPPAGVSGPGAADVTGSISGPPPAAAQSGPPPAIVASAPFQSQVDQNADTKLPARFQRQIVNFATTEPAGTIIIDTPNTYLYLVLGRGKALRYGIGVGREGFTWSGTERITRMKEWPDWFPPKEMIERQPYLPRFMAGGETNPLGARAMYLGNTLYRIHGTNDPTSIGKYTSSGCIHLTNEDVEDLYSRVNIGTRVVVLPSTMPATLSDAPQSPPSAAPVRYSAIPQSGGAPPMPAAQIIR